MKAVNDKNLYNVYMTENVQHFRHALALLEMRSPFQPMRFLPFQKELSHGQSCQEGWFLGDHGNIGGSWKDDGLSLWPLQWILSDAQKHGLVLGFKPHKKVHILNPIDYAMPKDASTQVVRYKNGLEIELWDLAGQFQKPGLAPATNVSRGKGLISTAERKIFDKSKLLIGYADDRMSL
jgi:hypothetical protein